MNESQKTNMKPVKSNHSTKQILILISGLIVILLALHYMAFRFIRGASVDVSNLQAEVNLLQAQVFEFTRYRPEEIRQLAQSVSGRIISRTNIVNFIEGIEREARTLGVVVTIRSVDVEPRSEDPNDYLENVRLRFETAGSWTDTMKFITYLEHLPYKATIQGLGVSRLSDDGMSVSANPLWKGTVEMTTLKYK